MAPGAENTEEKQEVGHLVGGGSRVSLPPETAGGLKQNVGSISRLLQTPWRPS